MPVERNPKPLVLRIVSRMSIGGVQNSILETLACADRRRFRFAVLCYKKAGNWAHRLKELGVPIHEQKAMPVWDPYQIWRLSKTIKAIDPDLVHVYMAPSVIVGVTAARLAGVEKIVIHHNSLYIDRHWNQQNAFLNAWEKNLTDGANAIIAVSRSVEACTRAWLGASNDRLQVIPDGVNFERFENPPDHDFHAELGVEKSRPIVGLVARYLEVKRIEDFIDAAAEVEVRDHAAEASAGSGGAATHPVFVIMGGGPDSLGDPLKARAEAVAEKADIRFLGGRNDLPALLPSLAVGVLCSEVEGCPNTILEYMAAGVPIAATNIPPIQELVTHEEHALLSPVRDPNALADSIRRLLTDRALADHLVEASRAHVRHYGWDVTESAYEAVYDRVLGREPLAEVRVAPARP